MLTADPVVQGAGRPSFEQRRDQVRSGHHRVKITGEIARSGVVSETVVAESGEHEGAIGVDLGAGGDDLAGELHLIRAVEPVGQIEPHSAQPATGEPLDGDGDRRLLRCHQGAR